LLSYLNDEEILSNFLVVLISDVFNQNSIRGGNSS
jgi:hypothetical protein